MNVKTWQEGLNKIIDNINQLIEDGDLLSKNGSYGHAYFLFYTAFEELSKAYYILARFDNPAPAGLKKTLGKHIRKAILSTGATYLPEVEDLPDIISVLKESKSKNFTFGSRSSLDSQRFKLGEKIQQRKNILYWRERSIYVDINSGNTDFLTPVDISIDHIKELHNILTIEVAEIQATRDTYVKFNDISFLKENFSDDNKDLDHFDQIIELLSFFNIVKKGSLHEISKFRGIDPQIKDYFIKILSNVEPEVSDLEKYLETLVPIIQRIFSNNPALSEKEKEMNEFYTKRLIFYRPDYFEYRNDEAKEFGIEFGKDLITSINKISSEEPLGPEELEFIRKFLREFIENLLTNTPEKQKQIELYEKQLVKEPKNIDLLSKLGTQYVEVGNYLKAKEIFELIYKMDKENYNAVYFLAEIEFSINNNFKRAIHLYKKLLSKDPEMIEAFIK